jgi:hypothetical protein
MSQGFVALLDEAYDRVTAIGPFSPSATPRRRTRHIQELGEANWHVGQVATHLQAILDSSTEVEDGSTGDGTDRETETETENRRGAQVRGDDDDAMLI